MCDLLVANHFAQHIDARQDGERAKGGVGQSNSSLADEHVLTLSVSRLVNQANAGAGQQLEEAYILFDYGRSTCYVVLIFWRQRVCGYCFVRPIRYTSIHY